MFMRKPRRSNNRGGSAQNVSLKGRGRQFADCFAQKEEIAVHRRLCTTMEERKTRRRKGRKVMEVGVRVRVGEEVVAEMAAWVVVVGKSSSCQRVERTVLSTAADPP